MTPFEVTVRLFIYRFIALEARIPTIAEVRHGLGVKLGEVMDAFESLAEQHVLVLEPNTRQIWMAMPFSARSTPHRVTIGSRSWWANCAWDALGIPAMLKSDAKIVTRCPLTDEAIEFETVNGQLTDDAPPVAHFALPASTWWEDIGFTRSTILFFRSEEHIAEWCASQDLPYEPEGTLSLETLRALAEAWYHDRLTREWRRPDPEQTRRIFDFLGLSGPHWQFGG